MKNVFYSSLYRLRAFRFTQCVGFSIIELLIVISIMAVISTIGVASYANFSQEQIIKSAALDIQAMLQTARSRASTQVMPSGCSGLKKYSVAICSVSVPPGVCNISAIPNPDYMLYATCGDSNNTYYLSSKKLPVGVTFVTTPANAINSKTINFSVLTGVITGDTGISLPFTIKLQGFNRLKTLTIDSAGTIAITDN